MKSISLRRVIPGTIVIAILLFFYVAVITEIKSMNNEKINNVEKYNALQNKIELKTIEIQKLTAEDRIVKIATDSLKLIRPKENPDVIKVPKQQIKQIEKLVNEKYD